MKIASILIIAFVSACSKGTFQTNGESIYKTGRNLDGKILLDKQTSKTALFKSCRACHGNKGNSIRSIQWSNLTDSSAYRTPYTEFLFFRFLDKDLKSDGSTARTGVHWKMSASEKADLLEFLKKL